MSAAARVTRYQIAPIADRATPQLKIAILADLHCNRPFMGLSRLASLVAQTNALAPDLVLLLGDYAGHVLFGREIAPKDVAATLAHLQSPFGVHTVFGNHDWYSDPKAKAAQAPTKWHKAFEDAGLKTYSNRFVTLQTDPPIQLAGLESQRAFHSRQHPTPKGLDDWPKLAAQLDPDRMTLLMAHEPDIFPDLPDWVDLTLSGHTHGGQIAPFGFPLIVPSKYGRRYAYGAFQDGRKQLVVSGGLGCSSLPIRVGRPPEIVWIDLK